MNLEQSLTRVREIVLISFLSILLTVGKLILASIPNIEVVSFLFIVYTVVLGFKRTFVISIIFTTVEILIWGFGVWTIGYYVFWPVLIIIASLLKNRIKTELGWAVVSGLYGLSFGLLFALYTAPLTKVNVFAYWLAGIQFDVVHMIGNFIVMITLYKPVKATLEKQYSKYTTNGRHKKNRI